MTHGFHLRSPVRLVPTRQLTRATLALATAILMSTGPIVKAAQDKPIGCSDFLYLIEQSKSRFSDIRKDAGSEFGTYDTAHVLSGAWYCAILEDKEKVSYQCAWKYPLGDRQAHGAFKEVAKEMKACIGEFAEEQTDRPVNHPDFYAAHYYQLPDGEVSVALKNKSSLKSTLVSIGVTRFAEPK